MHSMERRLFRSLFVVSSLRGTTKNQNIETVDSVEETIKQLENETHNKISNNINNVWLRGVEMVIKIILCLNNKRAPEHKRS